MSGLFAPSLHRRGAVRESSTSKGGPSPSDASMPRFSRKPHIVAHLQSALSSPRQNNDTVPKFGENARTNGQPERTTATKPLFDPADTTTWPDTTPSYLNSGAILPFSMQDGLENAGHQFHKFKGPNVSATETPCFTSPQGVSHPESDDFLALMDRKLNISPLSIISNYRRDTRGRSTSSDYPPDGGEISRVQSPASPPCPAQRLSPSCLAHFGNRNDCLSDLQSSASSGVSAKGPGNVGPEEVVAEAAAVSTAWQNQCPKLGPCSTSIIWAEETNRTQEEGFHGVGCSRSDSSEASSTVNHALDHEEFLNPLHRVHAPKVQYDGAAESGRVMSPEFAAPPQAVSGEGLLKRAKRKASQFSLHSITSPLGKKPRLGFKKLARNIYQSSGRRWSKFRQAWKDHNPKNHHGLQLPSRSGSIEGPIQGDDSPHRRFSLRHSLSGNHEWWKEGVTRYKAPGWMVFGSRTSKASVSNEARR